jgi:glycine oxidase
MVSRGDRIVIIGDGIVGLAVAMHCASRGLDLTLLSPCLAGAASPASAGMLAPSVERTQGAAQSFGDEAREAWTRFAALVAARAGAPFTLRRDGILRIALTEADEQRLRGSLRQADRWLAAGEVRDREPALGPVLGGALYTGDGLVDAPACLASLNAVLSQNERVSLVPERAASLDVRPAGMRIRTAQGTTIDFRAVVLAAGAWCAGLPGLPRTLPIRPLRGALLELGGAPLFNPVYANEGHGYVFPRGDSVMVGATSDEAGFDTLPTERDTSRLLSEVTGFLPDALSRPVRRTLVGLRPMTPDGLPILGPDPDLPGLIYACGHGRNGFLHAPLTGEVVCDLIEGRSPSPDITPFLPQRFAE